VLVAQAADRLEGEEGVDLVVDNSGPQTLHEAPKVTIMYTHHLEIEAQESVAAIEGVRAGAGVVGVQSRTAKHHGEHLEDRRVDVVVIPGKSINLE